jgi:tripartite-type tricarboxylate transporter receptor subunit TctC
MLKTLFAFCLAVLFTGAQAQDYPRKPVRVVVPGAPGSTPDILARMWTQRLGEVMNGSFIIDNKPGAGGTLGTDQAMKAPADGYTLLFGYQAAVTVTPSLYPHLPYKPETDMAPISLLIRICYALVTQKDSPTDSLPQFIELLKREPGRIPVASSGNGSGGHLFMEMLTGETGTQFTHVPYKSSPINDVLGGQIPFAMESMGVAVPLIKAGRIKALAVSSPKRLAHLAGVPAAAELVPGAVNCGWNAMWAPAGTPPDIITKVHAGLMQVAATPSVRQRTEELTMDIIASTPAELAATVKHEIALYSKIIRSRNIRLQ